MSYITQGVIQVRCRIDKICREVFRWDGEGMKCTVNDMAGSFFRRGAEGSKSLMICYLAGRFSSGGLN